jgi:SAM-dependent methyltransferase
VDFLILLAPAANRVYAAGAHSLVAAELEILLGGRPVEPVVLAGVTYLAVSGDPADLSRLSGLSAGYAIFERMGEHLRPVEAPRTDRFDDDLVSIPKYAGKTNEQFTRLLTNVTLAVMTRPPGRRVSILDPLCGRGTTLSTGLMLGHDVAGVDSDTKAVEAYAAFLKTYLRRRRLKHSADLTPVRREGRSIGRRLDVQVTPADGGEAQSLTVFTGDTRQSAALFGKRRFDAIVTDAPYGVVHGSDAGSKRDRSAAGLLAAALPVWATQLKSGGALGLAWNALGLRREALVDLAAEAGLDALDVGPFRRFAHRVDSSIHRDILVATKPVTG